MIQLQHVSFRDWNPIGKPRKKPQQKKKIHLVILSILS